MRKANSVAKAQLRINSDHWTHVFIIPKVIQKFLIKSASLCSVVIANAETGPIQ